MTNKPTDGAPHGRQGTLCVYLGDGLYGEFDGFGLTLKTDRDDRAHWVYLEPEVMQSLLTWLKALMLTYPELIDRWKP